MAHLFALGFQVAGVLGGLGNDRREALNDLNPVHFQCGNLLRIVRHQPDGAHTEMPQDQSGQIEDTAVRLVAKFKVRFDRIPAVVLQFVGSQLGHKTDATAFLLLIENDSTTGICDGGECQFKLLTAVAAQGMEDVAGKTLRMDANDGWCSEKIAHDQRDGSLDPY